MPGIAYLALLTGLTGAALAGPVSEKSASPGAAIDGGFHDEILKPQPYARQLSAPSNAIDWWLRLPRRDFEKSAPGWSAQPKGDRQR